MNVHCRAAVATLTNCQIRHGSTASKSQLYPFPKHSHPTPHQIFHLPPGASQEDIKARYFELVKIYHPDSPHARDIPQRTQHSQFQSVKNAYDVLRGRSLDCARGDTWNETVYAELERRRRHQPLQRQHSTSSRPQKNRGWGAANFAYSPPAWGDDSKVNIDGWNEQWKDNILKAVAVLAVGVAVFQAILYTSPQQTESRHRSAASNLAQARAEAREFGMQRRAAIRKRVQEQKVLEELEQRDLSMEDASTLSSKVDSLDDRERIDGR